MKVVAHDSSEFIKVPKNIGDWLTREANKKAWKTFRLYVKFLDMKAQNPDCGTFQIRHSHRYYQRTIKQLIAKGWVFRKVKKVYLRKYQVVWRNMGITRVRDKGILKFTYWKFPVSMFSDSRKEYLKELENEIRKKISKRKLAQTRFALRDMDKTSVTFSARSAGSLFGYRSPYSGSKLRNKYFEVVSAECKPRFSKARGRYEEPTKEIAI